MDAQKASAADGSVRATPHGPDGQDGPGGPDQPLAVAVLWQLRRSVSTRGRRVLVAVTVALGLVAAVAVAAGTPAPLRTFAFTSLAVQLLMSVAVPFSGVLLTADLRHSGRGRLLPRLLAALVLAVAYALFGVLAAAVAVAVTPSTAAGGPWQHAAAIVLGSVLVQGIAQLTGTGLGLLLRPPWVAMVATIVLPLGLWLVLGAVEPLRPAQPWLAPFTSASTLLSGQMGPVNWAQSFVVALVWGVGSNSIGAWLVRRYRRADLRTGGG